MAEDQSRASIEPTARRDPVFYTEDMGPQQDEVMTSIAISLKRIADQLDGTASGMNLWDFANGTYALLNDRWRNG
jgi:hypothetical protein